ncbi:hypothetical protein [Legionella oakridgensis]|nr:hypothetical protein [Legionella oakridgensis]
MPTHITLDISILEARVHRYLWQMLLQWTAISLSIITVLLALTQYRLTRDSIALIIGMAVLFSGLFELLQTVMMKELYPVLINKNLNALIWTVANSISGLVLMIGLILILTHKGKTLFEFL